MVPNQTGAVVDFALMAVLAETLFVVKQEDHSEVIVVIALASARSYPDPLGTQAIGWWKGLDDGKRGTAVQKRHAKQPVLLVCQLYLGRAVLEGWGKGSLSFRMVVLTIIRDGGYRRL
jgi:hypothetical protein